jgi:hypothetical protein
MTVQVTSTSLASSVNVHEDPFSCAAGAGNALHYAFGTYTVVVQLLNGLDQSLGSSSAKQIAVAASACDQIISGDCVENDVVNILVDGM